MLKRSHGKLLCLGLILLSSATLGCSQIQKVAIESESATIELEQISSDLEERTARIRLVDGQTIRKAVAVKVLVDSTSWIDTSGEMQTISSSEVCEIRYVNRGKGSLRGLIYVGGPASVFYLAVGGIFTNSILTKIGLGVATGIIYGAIPGYVIGHQTTYRFC